MNKPNGYDEAVVYSGYKKLPKGGYVCRIMKVEEGKSKATGAEQLIIYLDIADGEHKGYFAEAYRNDTREFPKWGCVAYQPIYDSTTGKTNPRFKAFLTAVEESNPGFVVDKTWGEDFVKFYKDKYVGFVFGDEYYIGNDGKERVSVKPKFCISVDKIKKGDFKVPEDVHPSGEASSAGRADSSTGGGDVTGGFGETAETDDDDIPF